MKSNTITKENKSYHTTFIAIDFETATSGECIQICQVGITVVENGKVKDSFSRLVQPYMNKYDSFLSGIHGINELMTKNAPTFRELWVNELSVYFNDSVIVAHNASFDNRVLRDNIEFYGIDYDVPAFEDTYKLFKASVETICRYLNIDYSEHHSAGFDSRISAELYLAASNLGDFADGIDPTDLQVYRKSIKKEENGLYSAKKIKKEYRVKSLENADKNSKFYDKIVVITGDFPIMRNELAQKLHSDGAKINTSISSKTDFVLIGSNPGPAKIKKIEELENNGWHGESIDYDSPILKKFYA